MYPRHPENAPEYERLERLLALAISRGDRAAELILRARIEGMWKAAARGERRAA